MALAGTRNAKALAWKSGSLERETWNSMSDQGPEAEGEDDMGYRVEGSHLNRKQDTSPMGAPGSGNGTPCQGLISHWLLLERPHVPETHAPPLPHNPCTGTARILRDRAPKKKVGDSDFLTEGGDHS